MQSFLDFEAPVAELEGKIAELRALAANDATMSIDEEVRALERKAAKNLAELYKDLTPWQKAQVARHPERPHTIDYIGALCTDYTPLAGDRKYAEDFAIAGGLARFRGEPIMVIGQERGHDTASRVKHNFGMARPEGYRKAVRLMTMADNFGLPVITFVDTAGAYPGIDAEARGQAEAIARSTDCCLGLGVPLLSLIIGEGGSGGAIAIATANAVLMMENSIYSVISPEGAASILWRDPTKARDAASAMKITAEDLQKIGIVDDIIVEPVGGAHRGREEAMASAGDALARQLETFRGMPPEAVRAHRREKFLNIGKDL